MLVFSPALLYSGIGAQALFSFGHSLVRSRCFLVSLRFFFFKRVGAFLFVSTCFLSFARSAFRENPRPSPLVIPLPIRPPLFCGETATPPFPRRQISPLSPKEDVCFSLSTPCASVLSFSNFFHRGRRFFVRSLRRIYVALSPCSSMFLLFCNEPEKVWTFPPQSDDSFGRSCEIKPSFFF